MRLARTGSRAGALGLFPLLASPGPGDQYDAYFKKYQRSGPLVRPSASLAMPGIAENLFVKGSLASGGPCRELIIKYVTDGRGLWPRPSYSLLRSSYSTTHTLEKYQTAGPPLEALIIPGDAWDTRRHFS